VSAGSERQANTTMPDSAVQLVQCVEETRTNFTTILTKIAVESTSPVSCVTHSLAYGLSIMSDSSFYRNRNGLALASARCECVRRPELERRSRLLTRGLDCDGSFVLSV